MKECFDTINQSQGIKITRVELVQFFKLLVTKITDDDMCKTASTVSVECLDEVWYQYDPQGTGQISWHQLRPIMESIVVCETAMGEEKRLFNEK